MRERAGTNAHQARRHRIAGVIFLGSLLGCHGPESGPAPEETAAKHEPEPTAAVGAREGTAELENPVAGMSHAELLACTGFAERGYFVEVRGDGEPQRMLEGLRIMTLSGKARHCCASIGALRAERPHITACASRADPTRACLDVDAEQGEYIDRTGRKRSVRVSDFHGEQAGSVLTGSLRAVTTDGEPQLALAVRFQVGKAPAVLEDESPYFQAVRAPNGR